MAGLGDVSHHVEPMLSGGVRRGAALAASILVWPAVGGAQTPDVVFGAWSSRPREVGARPSGLGGAFTAVADDSRAAVLNPAGIALVPDAEVAAATADFWVVAAIALRSAPGLVPPRPGAGAVVIPCLDGQPARPWALAAFAERTPTQTAFVEVVSGPGQLEEGTLSSRSERIGVSLARGLTSWLNVGATVSWSHLSLQARSAVRTAEGTELSRTIIEGEPYKARMVVGALAIFGPPSAHTSSRLGISYHRDLSRWSVERSFLDIENGSVAPPARASIEEPPVLSAGIAWRIADNWLVSAQVDRIWYGQALDTLRGGTAAPFRLPDGLEPRLGVEYTTPAPIGGYLKLRAGLRRETSGRARYEGADLALRQAFRGGADAVRGSAGASLFAEFYDRAVRLDLDVSQVVLATRNAPSEAQRRFSVGLTWRL